MSIKTIILLVLMILITAYGATAFASNVDTLPVHWVGFDSATLKGNVTNLDAPNGTAFFQYRETGGADWINSSQTEFVNSSGEYTLNVFGLDSNTNYTYRAVLDAETFVTSLIEENFTTNNSPTVEYSDTRNRTSDSFVFEYNVTDLGDEDNISAYVECYDSDTNLYTTNETPLLVNDTGVVQVLVDGLGSGVEYLCYGVAEFEFEGSTSQTYTEAVSVTTLNTDSESSNAGITNVKNTMYVVFALLVLIIFVTIVYFFMSMLGGDVVVSDFSSVVLWSVAGAIVLLIGYVIISAVAGTLIF